MTQPQDPGVAMGEMRERLIEALNTAYEPLPIEDPHPYLVKSQRHDGHGFMGSCHVCKGDVAELADAMLGVVGTWRGLMSLLDEHYPPQVFDGSSGDEGPRIVALIRAVDAERSSRQAWAEEAMRLQHFIETKMFPGVFGDPEPPIFPTVCACVTDEQAATLSPRFSRPVCAVHPEGGETA